MKRFKIVMLIVVCLLVFTLAPATIALAEISAGDLPSSWAKEDIYLAQLYGLGTEDNYGDYLKPASGNDLANITQSIATLFAVTSPEANNKASISRDDAINGLYNTLTAVLKANDAPINSQDPLTFFINNGIMAKRADNNYSLTSLISRQDLLIYAARTYEYLRYTLNQDSKGAFWKVSDGDNTVYLLGSIHVAESATYPLSKKINAAYESSDFLAVEADITSDNEHDYAYIGEKALLLDDTSIEDLISSGTYSDYAKAMENLEFEDDFYDKVKPWYASWIVEPESTLYTSFYGIDRHFLTRAGYDHKPVIEIEGTVAQIDVFDNFSAELQEALLASSLQEKATDGDLSIGLMLNLWENGDTGSLEFLIVPQYELTGIDKEYEDKLTNIRNTGMVEKILTYLENDHENDYFVVVGAAHYLGDTGIVKQLRLQGYTVTQIK